MDAAVWALEAMSVSFIQHRGSDIGCGISSGCLFSVVCRTNTGTESKEQRSKEAPATDGLHGVANSGFGRTMWRGVMPVLSCDTARDASKDAWRALMAMFAAVT